MFYPKNEAEELDLELFCNPTAEYRGAPFWAWNSELEPDELLRQIDIFKEMGMGGFHIHCRTGLRIPYLGEEFMKMVKLCNEKAKEEGMLCWLYDEDRWPSGAAGGLVTKEVKYRARHLLFSPMPLENFNRDREKFEDQETSKKRGYLLGCYKVILKDGRLDEYQRIEDISAESDKWYAYLELSDTSPWYNNQAYLNTLDKKAVDRFIAVTHENYYKAVGDEFGKSIPAIFTDEPQFTMKEAFAFAEQREPVIMPYTDDFEDSYQERYQESFLEHLPEVFWNPKGDMASVTRYRYHEHLCQLFTESFADNIGQWCKQHHIMLTGHMEWEGELWTQTKAMGEAMRSYRAFGLPGIDILCGNHEFNTAKQAASASHQYGRPGVMSELYGVTNWDYTFREHKLQGDWQAALGVTTRVHHLSWLSMEGEAKRDYPASIGYQSPWYKEYAYIEDHFARLNTALTRGCAVIKIGVIHPVESYWLAWGPMDSTYERRKSLDDKFANLTKWLLHNFLDFDFICESLFPELAVETCSTPLQVGHSEYDIIIVPACDTIRKTTLDRLHSFQKAGGKVLFLNQLPYLVDAVRSREVKNLLGSCDVIPFDEYAIVKYLKPYRLIDILNHEGVRIDNCIMQLRKDGKNLWLFIAHPYKKNNELDKKEEIRVVIKGCFKPILFDTLNGTTVTVAYEINAYKTVVYHEFYADDSILLQLQPVSEKRIEKAEKMLPQQTEVKKFILQPDRLSLWENNVVVLDMAQYRLDDGEWSPKEELLKMDEKIRTDLHLPLRKKQVVQPWAAQVLEEDWHKLILSFELVSDINVNHCTLALEHPEETTVFMNGEEVVQEVLGWYVDHSIKQISLPGIRKGSNEIQVAMRFNSQVNIEYMYVLGDFHVGVRGSEKRIMPKERCYFGNLICQGLPFYSGNITYNCSFTLDKAQRTALEIPQYSGSLLKILIDGREMGIMAFAPNRIECGVLAAGCHHVQMVLYGNRLNTFGQLHLSNREYTYFGADSWRTSGTDWAYEYQLKPMGILRKPVLHLSE